jgi:hypothetical protein
MKEAIPRHRPSLAAGLGACGAAIRVPPAIRKMIYTTNAVESLNPGLRKIIKTRGSFPTDEAALKLLFLAIRNAGLHWRRAFRSHLPVAGCFKISVMADLLGENGKYARRGAASQRPRPTLLIRTLAAIQLGDRCLVS